MKISTAAILGALGIVCASVLRLHWSTLPLERDVAVYSVAAQQMLSGRTLYTEIFDHKPPAVHLSYLLAQWIFGYSTTAIVALGIVASTVFAIGVGLLIVSLGGSSGMAAWGATIGALLSTDPFLEAHQPNPELLILAALSTGMFALTRVSQSRWWGAAAGVALAIAILLKPTAALPFMAAALWLPHRPLSSSSAISIGAGSLGTFALVMAWMIGSGASQGVIEAIVHYNQFYGGSLLKNVTQLELRDLAPRCIAILLPFLLLTMTLPHRLRRERLFLLTTVLATYLAIALPGRFYNHYYQLLLPPVIIGAALALSEQTRVRTWRTRIVAPLLLALVIGYELFFVIRFPGDSFSLRRHGPVFVQAKQLGTTLSSGADFWVWGAAPGLYFYAHKTPRTPILYSSPAIEGPLREDLTATTIAELSASPPERIVVDRSDPRLAPMDHPIGVWIASHYQEDEPRGMFALYRRTQEAHTP